MNNEFTGRLRGRIVELVHKRMLEGFFGRNSLVRVELQKEDEHRKQTSRKKEILT